MSAKAPVLSASRILNATRVAQAADDTGVTGWLKTAQFIVAAQLDETTGPWNGKVYKLQWRQSGGTFADLAATGEMAWGATTDLVNGNAVTSGEEACTNNPGGTLVDGWEVEGALAASALSLADEDYAEIQWAIDPAGANYSQAYEFQVYDVTTGAAIGTCSATVTTEAAPLAAINQISFRVRSGDLGITLNSATGWAAAQSVDASIDMGTRFRIRFELEETAGLTFNSALKLQYNKNVGGWVDAVAYPDTSPATTPVIWCRESDEYTDLDPTTEVLTGSTETFVAGDGSNYPAVAAVSLSNQSTQHEFVIEIPTWYDGALRNIATDYFDFRLVESDGTAFTGTYDNPRITLTERAGHIGATGCESPGFMGPVKDGNGNLYWVCEPSESDPKIMMLKSTDGGDKWLEMDGAGRPTTTDFESAAIVLDGDVIHMALDNGSDATYFQFNVSSNATTPDEWVIVDESIYATLTNTDQCAAIEVRSDGTVVAFYRRTVTNEGIYYKIRSTVPTWGSEVELDTTASTEFVAAMTVLGASDKIHIFYKDDTNFKIWHKSLNSSGTLSAAEEVMADASQEGAGINWAMTNAVYWDSSGTEKVMIVVQDDSDAYLYSITIANDGAPGTRKLVDAVTVNNNPVPFNGRQPTAMLAVDPATDTVYCFYVDLTTFDVWWLSNVDDGTWDATATEIHDAVEGEVIRGNVFTHSAGNGSATVVGYVWENGSNGLTGYQEYNEYEIPSAGENITLATASITAGGQATTIVPGAVSKALDTATVIAGGQALSVVPGTATITLATALANANGQALTIVPGLVSIALATALATAAGQIITIELAGGPISITLDTALLTANGQALTVVPGTATIALATALANATGQAVTITPGPVSISLSSAVVSATGQVITVGGVGAPIDITLGTASLTAGGQALGVVPGAVDTTLATATITAGGQQIVITIGYNIELNTATLTANGQAIDITPGAVSKALNTAALTASGQAVSIVPGSVAILLDTAALVAGGQGISIELLASIIAIVKAWSLDERSTDMSLLRRKAK